MSAWIFRDEQLHRVVVAMRCGNADVMRHGSRDQLGELLRAMNHEAVNQRYRESTRPNTPFRFVEPAPFTPMQAYKSLRCFRYQCSEGDVPERWTLYAELTTAVSFYARLLGFDEQTERWTKSENDVAYREAEWG